jgi:NADPH-dependent 2,4-dienoyl-CoA reductase/sulfur reductase-like enzyme
MVASLGAEFAAQLQARHESRGVIYFLENGVAEIIAIDSVEGPIVTGAKLTSGETIPCDVLVQAIGSHPNTEWLQGSGVDISDGVLTDGAMRAVDLSGHVFPDVFAVGDVARFPNPIFDNTPRRVEHWNIPIETAKRVGQVLAAKFIDDQNYQDLIAQEFAPIPSFWSDQFDMKILAFGNLGLANETKFIYGDISDECLWGYYRNGVMVGVCGIGMRSVVQSYRMNFKTPSKAGQDPLG